MIQFPRRGYRFWHIDAERRLIRKIKNQSCCAFAWNFLIKIIFSFHFPFIFSFFHTIVNVIQFIGLWIINLSVRGICKLWQTKIFDIENSKSFSGRDRRKKGAFHLVVLFALRVFQKSQTEYKSCYRRISNEHWTFNRRFHLIRIRRSHLILPESENKWDWKMVLLGAHQSCQTVLSIFQSLFSLSLSLSRIQHSRIPWKDLYSVYKYY